MLNTKPLICGGILAISLMIGTAAPQKSKAHAKKNASSAKATEPAVEKKESAPIWPWLVGGLALIAVIGGILLLVLRKKSDDEDEEDEDEDDDEEEEKPKKKMKKGVKSLKAKRAKE